MFEPRTWQLRVSSCKRVISAFGRVMLGFLRVDASIKYRPVLHQVGRLFPDKIGKLGGFDGFVEAHTEFDFDRADVGEIEGDDERRCIVCGN